MPVNFNSNWAASSLPKSATFLILPHFLFISSLPAIWNPEGSITLISPTSWFSLYINPALPHFLDNFLHYCVPPTTPPNSLSTTQGVWGLGFGVWGLGFGVWGL